MGSANARYFRALMDRFELTGHEALLEDNGPGYVGLSHADIETIARDIDLLINGSGHLHFRDVLGAAHDDQLFPHRRPGARAAARLAEAGEEFHRRVPGQGR